MKKITFLFCALMLCLSARANYYIVGDFNNWNAATAVEMTTTDGTNYTVQLDTLWGGFKITTARDWNHVDYGASSGSNLFSVGQTMSLVSKANGNNYNVNISGGYSNAVLSFAITNNTPQLTFVSGTIQNTSNYSPYYIVGDFNNWDVSTAIEMTTTDGSNYYVQLDSLWGSFKITNARDWNHTNWGAQYENYEISWNTNAYYWSDYLKNNDNWDEDPNYNIYVDRAYSNVKLRLNITNGKYRVAFNSADVFVGMLIMYSNWLYYEVTGLNPNTVAIVGNSISTATDLVIPDSIDLDGQNFAITAIADQAFRGNDYLTSLVVGNNVITIGAYAFNECNYLTNVIISDAVDTIGYQAFDNCDRLTDITIGKNVRYIAENAIYFCDNMTNIVWNAINCSTGGRVFDSEDSSEKRHIQTIVIGEEVETIPANLFAGCINVKTINLPNALRYIGSKAFGNAGLKSVTIPESVTYIGSYPFYNCDSLTSVTWNAVNVEVSREDNNNYYYSAFSNCDNITSFVFGNNVQKIPENLCYNMSGITSITIPNSVTYIGGNAFYGCTNAFTSLVINENVDTIGPGAFGGCNNITLVIWNARNCANVNHYNTWYRDEKGDYIYEWRDATSSPFPSSVQTFIFGDNVQKVPNRLCNELNQLTSIALPNTVRTIGNSAFSGCSGLISFTMENGVQTIGSSAFSYCSNLPQIVLPNTVTKIDNYAFEGCRNLTTAILGNAVDTIGGEAFRYCERLISIELPATVNYLGSYAFTGCSAMNKAIIHSTTQFSSDCNLIMNSQLDTIVAPASIFDVSEAAWPLCTKKIKYVRVNSGELTEEGFAVIRRSASTMETLDVSATTNTTIADEAFSNMYRLIALGLPQGLDRISYKAVAECVRLQSIDIPAGITEIGDRAFEDCRSLTTITFGGQSGAIADVALQTIGNWAFYNNHALQQLTIPAGVTTIGAGAFYGCTYLEDLAMPASLRNVGDNAFALCNHLTKMQVEADLPPMVAARTFFDVSRNIPVYVPDEAVNDYRNTAIWQEFFIRPISQAATGIETVRESDSDSQNEMLPDGKFFQNGKLLIRRNGKTYDAQGRLIR